MKALALAAALLLPASMVLAQGAPPPAPATAPAAAKPKRAPVAAHVAPPAQTSPEILDINQIVGIRQVDPATYEIDGKLQNGADIHLRMNAFVMQNLGMQLGTYGK